MLPGDLDRINERFRTPHLALVLAGVPIAGLVFTGRVELLAEVASLLHLVMAGLVCFSLVRVRSDPPPSYRPAFRCPGHPYLPLAGGVASFGLIAFMRPLSLVVGGGLTAAGLAWYLLSASRAGTTMDDRGLTEPGGGDDGEGSIP